MTQAATQAFLKLLPSPLPPSLRTTPANLYQILCRHPNNGVALKVHQIRWKDKSISDCYWQVTRSVLKDEGTHGKAWGRLYWKGKLVSQQEERIPGSLKYKWSAGKS